MLGMEYGNERKVSGMHQFSTCWSLTKWFDCILRKKTKKKEGEGEKVVWKESVSLSFLLRNLAFAKTGDDFFVSVSLPSNVMLHFFWSCWSVVYSKIIFDIWSVFLF